MRRAPADRARSSSTATAGLPEALRKPRSRGFYYGLLACTVIVLAVLSFVVLWYAFPYWLDELRPDGQVTIGLVSSIFEYIIILAFTTVLSTLILARMRQQRREREAAEEAERLSAARAAEIAEIEEELRLRFAANVPLLADVAQSVSTMNRAVRYVLEGLRFAIRRPPAGGEAQAMTLGDAAHILDAYYGWQVDLGRLDMAAGALRTLLPRLRQRGHALGMPETAFAQADGLMLHLDGLTRVSESAARIMHRAVHDVLGSAARRDRALPIMDCYRVTDLLFAQTISLIAYLEGGAVAGGLTEASSMKSLVALKDGVSGMARLLADDEKDFRAEVGDDVTAVA